MKLEKIIYQKAFVIGAYLQEKVGVEISIDEQDDPDTVFKDAKALVEKWHIENNPHLSESLPEIQLREDKISEVDEELQKFMAALATFSTEEGATHFLSQSTFKLYRPARQFIENKFKK